MRATPSLPRELAGQAERNARVILKRLLREIAERTDRLFFWILLAEWVAAILIVMRAPPARCGEEPVPVWAAMLAGGAITLWPMYSARANPGARTNQRQIAIAQAFMACLLVHFSRGRTEIHLAAIVSFIFVAL